MQFPLSLASGYTDGHWEVSDGNCHTIAVFYGPYAERMARAFYELATLFR